jgi:hypothetical protein
MRKRRFVMAARFGAAPEISTLVLEQSSLFLTEVDGKMTHITKQPHHFSIR